MTEKGRTPPHSDEAEQGVLGAVLLDNRVADSVADTLSAEHFYRPDHRAIWSTVMGLVVANRVADTITVHEAGGHDLGTLDALCQATPSARRARDYANIVVERWRDRELIRIGASLADDALRGVDPEEGAAGLIDRTVTSLMQLTSKVQQREPRAVGELAMVFCDYVSDLAEGKIDAIATGLTDFDKLTGGGIRRGELWVIGARPSMGKTALSASLARSFARQHPTGFLSQEDSLMALVSRHVAALGRVNLADLRNPKAAPESMWNGLTEGVTELSDLRLYLDDQASLTLADVRRKASQIKRAAGGLGVIVVDYLQLMVGIGDNRNIELGKIANGLKASAKELDCGVVLLSQMSREADKRNGPPRMSDLRDSGDIEGAADLIGLLHREYKMNPSEANKHHAELHVVKHKQGATDTVHLYFDGAHQRFSDWDGPPPSKMAGRASHAPRGGMD